VSARRSRSFVRHAAPVLAAACGVLAAASAAAQSPAQVTRLTATGSFVAAAPVAGDSAVADSAAAPTAAPASVERTALDRTLRLARPAARDGTMLVVSLAERRIWYVERGEVRYTAKVAVGKGTRATASLPGGEFATPRGRWVISKRDSMPLWVPPDWHYEQLASSTGRALRALGRRDTLVARSGNRYFVRGTEVLRRLPSGEVEPALPATGRELVVDGRIVVPPIGTTLRQYPEVLGDRRLRFGDGYGVHGTNNPASVGKAASHGCLRMRNDEVTALYDLVAVGTPIYIQ
jgi:lipoprotein-anchoring transpeptidase ErfK/SrfK